jgi:lipopolysaccharide transport system ATP-binding protein
MSSNDIAIRVTNVSKCFEIYDRPSDRLKQFLISFIARFFNHAFKNYFQEFWALRDISFELKKGDAIGIIGRNGSGKSTLLQIICGTLSPTKGSVEVNGRVAALLELGSGFNPDFSGRENIYLNASVLGLSKKQIDERYSDIVKFADIGEFIDQPVKTYSSGMSVRLAFAVIAHVDADILIIDEALAVGDVIFTQKCLRFINEFKRDRTILFVSHDASAVANISTSALWLQGGEVRGLGLATDVLDAYHQSNIRALASISASKNEDSAQKKQRYDGNAYVSQININAIREGKGGVSILSGSLVDGLGKTISVFHGGENFLIHMCIQTHVPIDGFLIGFTIKDRLGQKIIEENNSGFTNGPPLYLDADETLVVKFECQMPFLSGGKYSIDLAVAEGSLYSHINHTWIYDAIQIDIVPTSPVLGVLSVSDLKFNLERLSSKR